MGIISSGVKALSKRAVKKAPAKAAKKAVPKKPPRPKFKDYKMDAADYGMVALGPIAIGTEGIISIEQARQLDKNRALADQRKSEIASAKKKGSAPIGADKFGWAGRR